MSDPEATLQSTEHQPAVKNSKRRHEFFTDVALSGSQELRALLPITEEDYRRTALEAHSDGRAYFAYGVLDTVYQSGVAMMRWEDLWEDGASTNKDRYSHDLETRLVYQSIETECALWNRRLIEALVNVINFSTSNSQDYYRHWLLLNQFQDLVYQQKNDIEYFACNNRTLAERIQNTTNEIQTIEKTIDFTKCWYLREKKALAARPRPPVLAAYAQILRTALPLANPRERLELGVSYQHFSNMSEAIHFSPGNKYEIGDGLAKLVARCSLLFSSLLLRLIDLLNISLGQSTVCEKIASALQGNGRPNRSAVNVAANRAQLGDFVVVCNALARVIKVNVSAYGYESYRIRYLADPPGPAISEDEIPPFYISRLFDAAKMRAALVARMQSHLELDVRNIDPGRIEDSLEFSVQEAWKHGLRDQVLRRVPE